MTEPKQTLSNWLDQQYAKWQPTQHRKHRSLTAFAAYLGISQSYLSVLINNENASISQHTADMIAEKLGDDTIYDLVDLPRPDPRLRHIAYTWEKLTDEQRNKIAERAERYARENQQPYKTRSSVDKPD